MFQLHVFELFQLVEVRTNGALDMPHGRCADSVARLWALVLIAISPILEEI